MNIMYPKAPCECGGREFRFMTLGCTVLDTRKMGLYMEWRCKNCGSMCVAMKIMEEPSTSKDEDTTANDEEKIRKFVYRQLGEGPKTFADLRVKMCRVFGSEFNGKFSPLLLQVLRGEAEKGALRLDFESLYHVAVADPDKGDEQDDASRILDLPRALAIEVIAGLVELANMSGSGRGYIFVTRAGHNYLEDPKYPDDRSLEGYSSEALTVLAGHLNGR